MKKLVLAAALFAPILSNADVATVDYQRSSAKVFDETLAFDSLQFGWESDVKITNGAYALFEVGNNSKYKASLFALEGGYQRLLLSGERFYTRGKLGATLTRVSSKPVDIINNYVGATIGLDAGFRITENLSIAAGAGYKYLWNTTPDASCRDGWESPSIGKQGACSWHGGVVYHKKTGNVRGSFAKVGLKYHW